MPNFSEIQKHKNVLRRQNSINVIPGNNVRFNEGVKHENTIIEPNSKTLVNLHMNSTFTSFKDLFDESFIKLKGIENGPGASLTGLLNLFSQTNDKETLYNNFYQVLLREKELLEVDINNNIYLPSSKKSNVRFLITKHDGSVYMDTSKMGLNTFQNAKDKRINENHMSRYSIQQARDNISGFSMEENLSTSTNKIEKYYSFRIGPTPYDSIGIVRISIS